MLSAPRLARAARLPLSALSTAAAPVPEAAKVGVKPKAILLENIHSRAVTALEEAGYEVEQHKRALSGHELVDIAADCHILGIRSKTHLDASFFAEVGRQRRRLWTVGCFCIGTNQVDMAAATKAGVSVFNAPFSNTRSVAELTICEVVALHRRLVQKSTEVHKGVWDKAAKGCHEVRGRILGIIGYGRIGTQVSVLAEQLGMKVIFHDVRKQMILGNARQADSLEHLLRVSDLVTIHVPASPTTENMITAKEIALMKDGASLINNARGNLVDLDALAAALKSGKLAGAAVDVFPVEPEEASKSFTSPINGLPNVILTPHVGGSTTEAQSNIADEVVNKLINFIETGSTLTSANLPEVDMPAARTEVQRVLHLHHNVPGVLAAINSVMAKNKVNVLGQYLATNSDQGYVILDVEAKHADILKQELRRIPQTVWARSIYRAGIDILTHGPPVPKRVPPAQRIGDAIAE